MAVVTNDDGIGSAGLVALAGAADRSGLSVLVAAPLTEASGTSAGLTAAEDHRRVVSEEYDLPGVPNARAFGVGAHPGLISLVACHGAFGVNPDVVLSGVNRGANVGRAVLHSGTVGAALTASINGVRAMAVSIDVALGQREEPHWDTAAEVVAHLLPTLLGSPPGTVLNVNVPDVPVDRLLPPRWATLAPFGAVRSRVDRTEEGTIEVASVASDTELRPGSDAALLAEGHVTITALRSVSEDMDLQNGLALG